MPGAYTHITLAQVLTSGNALNDMNLHDNARGALLDYSEFCHMGAISPDYPYLKLVGNSKNAEHWANSMHHKYPTLTEENIFRIGIDYLKNLSGDEQQKCVAWFFGYASHVIADVTCHPVTNLLVGDYDADNQTAHRVSEMHQDVYIFKTVLGNDVRKSEHIKNVIGACHDPGRRKKIDSHVENMWGYIMKNTFPKIYKKCKPDINGWHRSVQLWLDKIAEELSIIPSRHIRDLFSNEGIAYPRFIDIDKKKYINSLKTPKGTRSYDQIFEHAKSKAGNVWKLISDGIFLNDTAYMEKIKIWDLDSGQEAITNKVMWG